MLEIEKRKEKERKSRNIEINLPFSFSISLLFLAFFSFLSPLSSSFVFFSLSCVLSLPSFLKTEYRSDDQTLKQDLLFPRSGANEQTKGRRGGHYRTTTCSRLSNGGWQAVDASNARHKQNQIRVTTLSNDDAKMLV